MLRSLTTHMATWRFEGAAESNRDAAAWFPNRPCGWPIWPAQPVLAVLRLEPVVSQRPVQARGWPEQPRPAVVRTD